MDAVWNLALCYKHGTGTRKNLARACALINMAAAAEQPDALNFIGERSETGRIVERDLSEAARYYRLAANKGLATAQKNLGRCHQHGWGVPRDPSRAMLWYQRAAAQGDPQAHRCFDSLCRIAANRKKEQ